MSKPTEHAQPDPAHAQVHGATHATATAMQWDSLAPGFADPVHDSQATFRTLLEALSRPGRIERIALTLDTRAAAVPGAALAALYTLCDFATPVWLAQPNAALATALRFHTGAPLARAPGDAAFAWIAAAQPMPQLSTFALGDPQSPEHASVVLIEVASFQGGRALRLSGPGIKDSETLAPQGLPADFWAQRGALAALFPCGIDIYLICGDTLVGVPRTTLVEEC